MSGGRFWLTLPASNDSEAARIHRSTVAVREPVNPRTFACLFVMLARPDAQMPRIMARKSGSIAAARSSRSCSSSVALSAGQQDSMAERLTGAQYQWTYCRHEG